MAGGQTKEQKLAELKKKAQYGIIAARAKQKGFWDSLLTDVHTAQSEFTRREFEIIKRMLVEIANPPTYPIWMDVVIDIATSVLPINHIMGVVAQKLIFSKQKLPALFGAIPKLPRNTRTRAALATISLKDPKEQLAIMRGQKKVFIERKEQWIASYLRYLPEAENDLRTFVNSAAKMVAEPFFTKGDLAAPAKAVQKLKQEGAAAPATEIFRWLLTWIDNSRNQTLEYFDILDVEIQHSDNEEWLKSLPDYLESTDWEAMEPGTSLPPTELNKAPPEAFLRFVEACLWCTTYDFTPAFKPAHIETVIDLPVSTAVPVDTKIELFPFPKDFWAYLVSRHYDPFYKDGTMTYKDIGPIDWIAGSTGPGGDYYPGDKEGQAIVEAGMIYQPAERLSMHWSGILMPALFNENKKAMNVLDNYLMRW